MRIRKVKGSRKTECSKCNEPLNKRYPKYRYCNKCHADYMKEYRTKFVTIRVR